ncbi:2-aminoethylphosphonate--pyruvate transaminase [Azospirillum thermophilum]|uniref:2-aminoethylphosphonate--pyruvate transaminase n=1 Tax=Azospirillum thermophilum TaxID=2202148 RepID=A0A2S2CKD7_9PROT|nr:2-aminoethylphosphonate--pyruvate transaminase [Azospirillum thermophilum]AWK84978.1 2-aminoethylphosphonate--pyruvate transaminase [Azospirillum thermophilum]
MTFPPKDPFLLTPGPLTTSATVKQAMLRDWGSRDGAFIELNARIRNRLVEMIGGGGEFAAVPLQGSGTFAVEAMIGTLVPRTGKLLVLVNGAYGHRMVRIAEVIGRAVTMIETAEDLPVSPEALDRALAEDPAVTHVAVVQCETTSGILNPLQRVAEVTARHGRALLVDAMSAFGALPLDARETPLQAVAASSNKCLEGVPGTGFVLVRRTALEAARGNAHSLTLDLHDQWRGFEANAQWRFTPPTHVLAAFDQALSEHAAEGGVAGRGARYRENCRILVEGLRAMGFETLLPDALQAPVIVTVRMPADPAFDFPHFYERMRKRGYVLYPGKLTVADSFRIGCIGRLGAAEMRGALEAIRNTLAEMGVASGRP